MHVLLDECLPRKLKAEIVGHEVSTVPEVGWAGKENGELLQLAAKDFDVFVTIDANIPAQQN